MKFDNILNMLSGIASKSSIEHKHGAILIHNGKPVEWGYNLIRGKTTVHAEYNVIDKYITRMRLKKIKQYLLCE